MVENKQFNELVKIKKEIEYMPSYEKIMEFGNIIRELFQILLGISNKEVKMREVNQIICYKPKEIDSLVNKISKKYQIKDCDKDILMEFMYENEFKFPYWIYNGEQKEFDEDFYNLDDFDIDIKESIIDESDLPF